MLPAYLIGLMVASTLAENRDTVRRLRTAVFSFLTPFSFLKAGSIVSVKAMLTGLVLIVILLAENFPTPLRSRWSRECDMFEKILVGIDGSQESEKALQKAMDLAAQLDAELTAISVVEFTEIPGTVSEVDAVRENDCEVRTVAAAVPRTKTGAWSSSRRRNKRRSFGPNRSSSSPTAREDWPPREE